MYEYKIDEETAKQEVNKWLTHMAVRPKKMQETQAMIEVITEAVMLGFLSFNEDNSCVLKLENPITSGASPIEELKFKSRITVAEYQAASKGRRIETGTDMIYNAACVYAEKLEVGGDVTPVLLSKLESNDKSTVNALASFFLQSEK